MRVPLPAQVPAQALQRQPPVPLRAPQRQPRSARALQQPQQAGAALQLLHQRRRSSPPSPASPPLRPTCLVAAEPAAAAAPPPPLGRRSPPCWKRMTFWGCWGGAAARGPLQPRPPLWGRSWTFMGTQWAAPWGSQPLPPPPTLTPLPQSPRLAPPRPPSSSRKNPPLCLRTTFSLCSEWA